MSNGNAVIDVNAVKSRMLVVRGQQVLLGRDVAALYGVQTKEVNQAVRNNPAKFPEGFLFQLTAQEFADWKSKILTSNLSSTEKSAIKMGVRRPPNAFTERGLYMLATVLKGELAIQATLAIVNAYAQLRSMVAIWKRFSRSRTAVLSKRNNLLELGTSSPRSSATISRPNQPRRRSNSTSPVSRSPMR